MAQLADDWRGLELPDNERAMLEFAETVSLTASTMTEDNAADLRNAGWSDREILDITLIISYYNLMCRLADALGVGLDEGLVDQDLMGELERRKVTPHAPMRMAGGLIAAGVPTPIGDVKKDAVGPGPLELMAPLRLHAKGLVDVVPRRLVGGDKLLRGLSYIFDMDANVVEPAEPNPELRSGRAICLEVKDGQIKVAVGQDVAVVGVSLRRS